jgi:hypothetical protein
MSINRRVIQDTRIHFYPVTDNAIGPGMDQAEDWGYCHKAWDLGYIVAVDWTIRLLHLLKRQVRPWTADGDGYVPFRFSTA